MTEGIADAVCSCSHLVGVALCGVSHEGLDRMTFPLLDTRTAYFDWALVQGNVHACTIQASTGDSFI
jgi:hypothetical protein